LRYYEIKQLPNFLLATPMILLSLVGIARVARRDPLRFLTLGFLPSPSSQVFSADDRGLSPHPDQEALFFASTYLWALLLAYSLPLIHIQVITRLFSSLPGVYWTAASLFLSSTSRRPAGALSSAPRPRWQSLPSLVLPYFLLYSSIGVVLFSNFYPPA